MRRSQDFFGEICVFQKLRRYAQKSRISLVQTAMRRVCSAVLKLLVHWKLLSEIQGHELKKKNSAVPPNAPRSNDRPRRLPVPSESCGTVSKNFFRARIVYSYTVSKTMSFLFQLDKSWVLNNDSHFRDYPLAINSMKSLDKSGKVW